MPACCNKKGSEIRSQRNLNFRYRSFTDEIFVKPSVGRDDAGDEVMIGPPLIVHHTPALPFAVRQVLIAEVDHPDDEGKGFDDLFHHLAVGCCR